MLDLNSTLRLYLVAGSDSLRSRNLAELVRLACAGGATCVQLREKNKARSEVLSLAKEVKLVCDAFGVPLIINDYVEVAAEVGAAGVHLGQGDGSVAQARQLLGPDVIIGVSAHNVEEALAAAAAGASYIGAGAVLATSTKPDASTLAHDELRRITEACNIPVVAIGGITGSNAVHLASTGIAGIAVSSAILHAHDPQATTTELLTKTAGQGLNSTHHQPTGDESSHGQPAGAGSKGVCHVVCASPDAAGFVVPKMGEGDLLIAADGGWDYCQQAGLQPDFFIGDCDSLTCAIPPSQDLRLLPTEKDDTDCIAALREGLARGYEHFVLYAALGGCIGHTMGALQTLSFLAENGATGQILHKNQLVCLLSSKLSESQNHYSIVRAVAAGARPGSRASFFAFGCNEATASLSGFKWNLSHATISAAYPLGVSNEIALPNWRAHVHNGQLLAVFDL